MNMSKRDMTVEDFKNCAHRYSERCSKVNRTAKKVAQLLTESQATVDEIEEIFSTSKEFLTVSFSDPEGLLDRF